MNHIAAVGVDTGALQRGRRIADIEVLRAFAIVMVLIEHMPTNLVIWPSHLFAFTTNYCRLWTGVDLFFAISGFVIGRNMLPHLPLTQVPIAYGSAVLAFWARRAWRLLPSAWVWLAIPLVLSFTFNRGGYFNSPTANYEWLIAGVLNVANFHLAEHYGQRDHWSVLFPYWSLSFEEQFYLLLPVLIFVLRSWLPALLGLIVMLQFVLPNTLLANMVRPGALALGVLLAFASTTRGWRLCEPTGLVGSWPARTASLVVPVLLLGALGSDGMQIASFRVALVALVAAGLVWVASYDRDIFLRIGLPRRAILWLGSRSYGIYLIHLPAFSATREIWFRLCPPGTVFDGRFAWRFGLTAMLIILAASELNHRLLEQPLRRHGARVSRAIASRVVT